MITAILITNLLIMLALYGLQLRCKRIDSRLGDTQDRLRSMSSVIHDTNRIVTDIKSKL